jgi:protoporphyrinogen oxidase
MNIAIIGGGFAGLTAAHELLKAGHRITVYEAAPQVGGLAAGFKAPHWDWKLEKFYHHIFETDKAILALAREIGVGELVFFKAQTTAFWCAEHGMHPVSIPGILTFPHLPLVDRLRYGLSLAQFKARNDWRRLEQTTAKQHLLRWAGPRAYKQYWEPLLVGKFGPYADEINAAWIWARVKTRSFRLGYFRGGFQAFADALAAHVMSRGAMIQTGATVERVEQDEAGWSVRVNGSTASYDRVIVASSPSVLARLVPDLPAAYTDKLRTLRGMGAVVLVAALSQSLLTNGVYWLMPPKPQFPFLALVEHTNMIDRRHYGGDRLIYCGDYLPADHRYFSMDAADVTQEWLGALPIANPDFRPEWITQTWLFRERYAQPIVPTNHSHHVPSLHTPLDGLYFASMAHVYPWDRGTNFAVELGQRVAQEVITDPAPVAAVV